MRPRRRTRRCWIVRSRSPSASNQAAAIVDRYTTRDVALSTITIPAGELVSVSLAGANRDPRSFPDPDRFDLDRTNASDHLAFVTGPHACLGARLARAEATALISTLLARCLALTLDPRAERCPVGLHLSQARTSHGHLDSYLTRGDPPRLLAARLRRWCRNKRCLAPAVHRRCHVGFERRRRSSEVA